MLSIDQAASLHNFTCAQPILSNERKTVLTPRMFKFSKYAFRNFHSAKLMGDSNPGKLHTAKIS